MKPAAANADNGALAAQFRAKCWLTRTGLKHSFCSGLRYAGCHFVKLRENILGVSQWITLRFFRSLSSSRLASRQPRDKAIFETGSRIFL
jgi:hypothetical protein